MSSYYNFYIINLNEVTEPPVDEEGLYNFHAHSEIEEISMGKIESRTSNYAASEVIDLLFASGLIAEEDLIDYRMFFGNLFWIGNDSFYADKNIYLKDAWSLRNNNEHPVFYSINGESVKKIASLETKIDFSLIKNLIESLKPSERGFDMSFNSFFEVTQEWLSLYKIAIMRNAGIVYDIG